MDATRAFNWDGGPAPEGRVPAEWPGGPRASRPRRRRRHVAKRSRMLAALLSAATFLGLAGSMAARAAGTSTVSATTGSATSTGSGSSSSSSSRSNSSSSSSSSSGTTGWSASAGSTSGSGQTHTVSHAS